MATINAVNATLLGQTGTGLFVGSISPTITGITTDSIRFQTNGNTIKSADGFACIGIYNGGGTSVNYTGLVGGATGVAPQLFMVGTDTNVGLQATMQAAGVFTIASTSSSPSRILSGTAYQHSTVFSFANTSASRTVTFPDADGTVLFAASSGGLKSFQVFTSGTAATYTRPAGITSILVQVLGGGGGGGGSTGGVSTGSQGAGGGAGGYSMLWVASASSTYTYTVGAGGAGGTAGANTGSTGGTTTFSASSLQATGGVGGGGMGAIANAVSSAALGGDGGVGTNGIVNSKGMPGFTSLMVTSNVSGASGGSSHFGGGGVISLGGTGGAGGNYGSGGAGGYSSTVSAAGGAGSAGLIIVWEFA